MEVNMVAELAKFLFLGIGMYFAYYMIKAQGKILRDMIPVAQKVEEPKILNVVIQAENFDTTCGTKVEAAKMAAIIAAIQHHKNLKG